MALGGPAGWFAGERWPAPPQSAESRRPSRRVAAAQSACRPGRRVAIMRLVVKINCCKVPKYTGERLFKVEFRGKRSVPRPADHFFFFFFPYFHFNFFITTGPSLHTSPHPYLQNTMKIIYGIHCSVLILVLRKLRFAIPIPVPRCPSSPAINIYTSHKYALLLSRCTGRYRCPQRIYRWTHKWLVGRDSLRPPGPRILAS